MSKRRHKGSCKGPANANTQISRRNERSRAWLTLSFDGLDSQKFRIVIIT